MLISAERPSSLLFTGVAAILTLGVGGLLCLPALKCREALELHNRARSQWDGGLLRPCLAPMVPGRSSVHCTGLPVRPSTPPTKCSTERQRPQFDARPSRIPFFRGPPQGKKMDSPRCGPSTGSISDGYREDLVPMRWARLWTRRRRAGSAGCAGRRMGAMRLAASELGRGKAKGPVGVRRSRARIHRAIAPVERSMDRRIRAMAALSVMTRRV